MMADKRVYLDARRVRGGLRAVVKVHSGRVGAARGGEDSGGEDNPRR